jgi:hypothetical protein
MNISDDIEYLCTSRYFNENVGSLFKVSEEIPSSGNYGDGSRGNKQRLNIQGSLKSHNISFIDLGIEQLDDGAIDIQPVINDPVENNDAKKDDEGVVYEKPRAHSYTESSDSSNDSSLNYSSDDNSEDSESQGQCEEEDNEGEDDESDVEDDSEDDEDDSDSEDNMFSYMDNFPIQMICLEKCEGTIDKLFEKGELSEKEGAAAMMQIVMTLIAYQRAFSFTHNDLHTNNIMYVSTDAEFLVYKYNKKTYRVPTYGRIFKIIDFGRSIYRFCGKIFCSDSFAPGGDASSPTIANMIRWQTGEVERYMFHTELQLVPRGRRRVVVDYAALLRR